MIVLKKKVIGFIISLLLTASAIFAITYDFKERSLICKLKKKNIEVKQSIIMVDSHPNSSTDMYMFVKYNNHPKINKLVVSNEAIEVYKSTNSGRLEGITTNTIINGVDYFEYFGNLDGLNMDFDEKVKTIRTLNERNLITLYTVISISAVVIFGIMFVVFGISLMLGDD